MHRGTPHGNGHNQADLFALDAATGAVIWSTNVGIVSSGPAVANGVVYVSSNDNSIYALDAVTGAILWQYETGSIMTSSPAVADGALYVASHDGHLFAFSLPAARADRRSR